VKILAILLLALGAGACATGGPEGGVASYDALRQAQQDCAARGGTMRLKPQGDPQSIQAYACERK
jgi:hypothetical protein